MHTDFTDWTDLRVKKNDLKIRNAPTILLHSYTLNSYLAGFPSGTKILTYESVSAFKVY